MRRSTSYLLIITFFIIGLLNSNNCLLAEGMNLEHLTTSSSETFTQSDDDTSTREFRTTLDQKINLRSSVELTEKEDNQVDSILGEIHTQWIQLNSSVDENCNTFKEGILGDVDLMREELRIEATASLCFPISLLISLIIVIFLHIRGRPLRGYSLYVNNSWISIFGIILVASVVLTLLHFSDILIYFNEMERSVLHSFN